MISELHCGNFFNSNFFLLYSDEWYLTCKCLLNNTCFQGLYYLQQECDPVYLTWPLRYVETGFIFHITFIIIIIFIIVLILIKTFMNVYQTPDNVLSSLHVLAYFNHHTIAMRWGLLWDLFYNRENWVLEEVACP